jgi:hypothetical protein
MSRPDITPDDDTLDPMLARVVGELRAQVPARPAAIDALKSAIRAERTSVAEAPALSATNIPRVTAQRSSWLFSRTVQTSPVRLLAAAMLLITLASSVTALLSRRGSDPAAAIAASGAMRGAAVVEGSVVRFTLAAPDAKQVALVGDFNGWDATATALEFKDGTWTVVIPVAPGRHQYGFVVDGSRWSVDPTAPQSADADFGSDNSIVYVGS